jgi:hypothetical protein
MSIIAFLKNVNRPTTGLTMGGEIKATCRNCEMPQLSFRVMLKRAIPGLALCALGLAMLWLARGQPAWVGANVGPGLMAQLLAKGVIAIGCLWALWRALRPEQPSAEGCGAETSAQPWSGPALLGAVFLFALTLPILGLVISASLAATLAALGAGERGAVALGLTVTGLAALIAIIGVTLLPPTTKLWPTL